MLKRRVARCSHVRHVFCRFMYVRSSTGMLVSWENVFVLHWCDHDHARLGCLFGNHNSMKIQAMPVACKARAMTQRVDHATVSSGSCWPLRWRSEAELAESLIVAMAA